MSQWPLFILSKSFAPSEHPLSRHFCGLNGDKLAFMSHFVFRSAGFTVHPITGQVKSGNETVSLGPVNMKVLLALIHSQGNVVSRSDIYQQVWGNQVVSDDALTRCISDLRSQLTAICADTQLIETLPKRGYRWLPDVEKLLIEEAESKKSVVLQYLVFTILSVILVVGGASALLWYLSQSQTPSYTQFALLPIKTSSEEQQTIAVELEDALQQQMLKTTNMRFLSRSVLQLDSRQRYPYFSGELGAQWVVEGEIRNKGDSVRVSLSLVDANTALVTFSVYEDLMESDNLPETFVNDFIDQVSQLLGSVQ